MRKPQEFLNRRARRRTDPTIDGYLHALVDGVSGSVVEIGCGVGNLFPYYPRDVAHLLAIEPDPIYRAAAGKAAGAVEIVIEVSPGPLPIESHSVDFVVCSNTFCSLDDPAGILAEIGRILRPDGELRLIEHVAARTAVARGAQRAVDALGWPRLLNGCHASRRTIEMIQDSDFAFVSLHRFNHVRTWWLAPLAPHAIGAAKRVTRG